MNLRNNTEHYALLPVALHWSMLVLLAAVYACMELSEFFPKGSDPREALKTWHYTLGLSVFVLVWLRIAVHLGGAVPRIEPAPPKWQQVSAKLVHAALYMLMVGLPIVGWLILSARGRPIPFFGMQLPALIGESRALGRVFKEMHEIAGTVGYLLVALHAAAALFHHYVARDNTLRRMLPRRYRG